jgi:serine/threonine-protein kinase
MGEVYRADDLKLGQQIAIKFLPPQFANDKARLLRLADEVRVARQISHANVCRVYDIGEAAGEHFLTMEYIHGEDLATLLHRIGRLPKDKALQIARQLCAGLQAAHEQGMVHRDLKPANIMLDERGVARITDFGLARQADDAATGAREGTPAYMAPEQLLGGGASVRSDLYALGLVLYELFTGQRPWTAKSLAELARARDSTTPIEPSTLVDDLDPAVERVILRCLERAPRDRPVSAIAVAAALPGGDALAAALAAGDTPSPEAVAAAGAEIGIEPLTALLFLCAFFLLAAIATFLRAPHTMLARLPLPHSPDVLAAKARDTLERLGFDKQPEDTATGFAVDEDYVRWVQGQQTRNRWDGPVLTRPAAALRFWYRGSPRSLEPENFFGTAGTGNVSRDDPPLSLSDMTLVELDTEGRLLSLAIVPPQVDDAAPAPAEVDWTPLYAAAGLDPQRFKSVLPTWSPLFDVDARAAWEGSHAERPDVTLRLEAAGFRGRPVWFGIVGPWSRPARMRAAQVSPGEKAAQAASTVILCGIIFGALLVARRSLRLGRGDRRGAGRLAAAIGGASLLSWAASADHVWTSYEWGLLVMAVSWALFTAAVVWVLYIAAEPYVRRRWPQMLISWTRLLGGRPADPLVGRDLLIGALGGAALATVAALEPVLRARTALPAAPSEPNTFGLSGLHHVAALLLGLASNAVFSALAVLFLLLVLRALLRRDSLASLAFVLIFLIGPFLATENKLIEVTINVGVWLIVLLVLRRAGLTATAATFACANCVLNGPARSDFTAWHSIGGTLGLLAASAVACYGFARAKAGRPLFRAGLLDD